MRTAKASKGYSDLPIAGNPRHTEAWALARCARQMHEAKERGATEDLLVAVRLNWQLWTILQAELLEENCPLPDDIRSNALSLANFIDKQTVEFLSAPKPENVDILISINRELSAGLYQTPDPKADGTPLLHATEA